MSEYANISPQTNVAAADSAALLQTAVEPGGKDIFSIAAQRLPTQRKLSVGAVDDPLEHEADAMADKVMRIPDTSFIQRKCSHCEQEEAQRKPLASFIQKKESATSNTTSDATHTQIQATRGGGSAMPANTKTFMESRFGADFSGVRIHSGGYASQLSNELNAQAFTVGNDIYFNSGKFSPDSSEGKHLLAHELTHTVQQGDGSVMQRKWIQRKVNAIRFLEDATLSDISDGKKVFKEGDKDPAIIKITQAISELGFYGISIIDERFDPPLTSAITNYQAAKALTGKSASGQMDKPTFDALDKDFQTDYAVERNVVSKQKTADLFKGTDSVNAIEKGEADKAISTEVALDPVTKLPPVFVHKLVGKGEYKDRLLAAVDKEIVDQFDSMGKGKAAAHADPTKIYDWKQIDIIAKESQSAVDAVFGEYKKGPQMKGGVTIMDAWADKEKQLTAGGKAAEDSSAVWRVNKILTGDKEVKKIDREHGVIQSRGPEKAIVDPIRTDMITKHRAELIETHKGWPGYEDSGKVFIQLFKESTDTANRRNMWDYYQTFIHEYIHSLEHANHIAYRGGKDEQKGGFTLREGVTDYFTKVVWSSINITDALRKTIEGPFNDPVNKFAIPALNTYDEALNAERLAGVVGIRNVAAAFFLGRVNLIGK
jgi:hypothetical protein